MIYYDSGNLWAILCRWQGSAVSGPAPLRALCMALFAATVATANYCHPFVIPTRESTAFVDTLTVFNTFIGLTVSFRLNSAFEQWRSGVVATSSLSEAARGIVSSGCAYVSATLPPSDTHSPTESGGDEADHDEKNQGISRDTLEKFTFFTELRRLVFLYIAIVFHDCRGRDGIDKMKEAAVLTDSEYDELYACGSERPKRITDNESFTSVAQQTPHKLRATIVELWLKRLVEVASRRGHLSPGNASMLQTKIAQLPLLYTTVYNIANVPIPFNYMQYLQYLLVTYMMLYTFVIIPRSELYTPLWVFGWGLFLFTADQVAMEIENPFGLDANDIDLEARLLNIEEELTVLVRSQYYFVSGGKVLPVMYTQRGHSTAPWSQTQTPHSAAPHSHQAPSSGNHILPSYSAKESFSFHQGRTESQHTHGSLFTHDSLPEINEFTALISSASGSVHSRYGSSHSLRAPEV